MHFAVGRLNDAADLIIKFHYSRRIPSNIQVCATAHEDGGLFGDLGRPIAACVFTIPPTRWSEDVLELARLVRRDDVKLPLTWLIGKTLAFIRQKKLSDLVVSFADSTQKHHGGIYQAASWLYHGKRDRRMDGLLVNGAFISGRAANHKYGTRSPTKIRERVSKSHLVEAHYDDGKYLYWRPLASSGKEKAKRLGLVSCAYPKPAVRPMDERPPSRASDVQPVGTAPSTYGTR